MNEQPAKATIASGEVCVGDLIAAFLEGCGLTTAFGVISIHNLPILDAIARRGRIRFIPARGEAGALNMADAYARVSGGLGLGITSTGVAAGNAAGSLIEAMVAGSPVLHLTGQIETSYLDKGQAYIHEAPDQPGMLKAISKSFFRASRAGEVLEVLTTAVQTALTAPMGPVSVEIPIDVQSARIDLPSAFSAPLIECPAMPHPVDRDALVEALIESKRPLLWLGGGARAASEAAMRLVEKGIGVVTSVNGRGIVPEGHPLSLGAFNNAPPVEAFYQSVDLMVVVGSRLRGNETLKYTLGLPGNLIRIDVDAAVDGRSYPNQRFICADADCVLSELAGRLPDRLSLDPSYASDLRAARTAAVTGLMAALGPYAELVDQLQTAIPKNVPFVRDVTLSNSTWGNRLIELSTPQQGVHALGGGIGQGLAMAIGASCAAPGSKTVALIGDGGLAVNLGELATLVQERADIVILLMNDKGYGVIRNIQDAHYGGRRNYVDLTTPDFAQLACALGLAHSRVESIAGFGVAFDAALAREGPALIEIDMDAIGPFAEPFAGPLVRERS
ncbi:MAG: thiamine pyrophosphate-binding protein [Alphaproteobacteria bacterium]|nr:thiamine pyrophosphate-binding protein [Alphaproteobacteria bacterium]